jgi:hypothetical protein
MSAGFRPGIRLHLEEVCVSQNYAIEGKCSSREGCKGREAKPEGRLLDRSISRGIGIGAMLKSAFEEALSLATFVSLA